jgi:hypothetical protein
VEGTGIEDDTGVHTDVPAGSAVEADTGTVWCPGWCGTAVEIDAGAGVTTCYAGWCDIPQVDPVRSQLVLFARTEVISAAFSLVSSLFPSMFPPAFSPETPVGSSVSTIWRCLHSTEPFY